MKSGNPGRSERVRDKFDKLSSLPGEKKSCEISQNLPALEIRKNLQSNERTNCGKKVGRPRRLDAKTVAELKRLYLSNPYSVRELADMFGVSRMTVWRAVQNG